MSYQEYKPVDCLSRYVKCFWSLEHDYSREPFKVGERIWPDGHYELIFGNGEPYFQKIGSKLKVLPRNFLIGQFNRELILVSNGITRLTAVRFHAWGLYPFLKTPMNLYTNTITDSLALHPGEFRQISADLRHKSEEDRIKTLETFLRDSLNKDCDHCSTESIARQIVQKKGSVAIRELTETHQINARTLQRQFEIEIGLSAKHFAKIIRFNHAKKLIQRDPHVNLAEVAYTCGYADQPHFIKNFKSLYGITPTQFKKQLFQLGTHL